jgi:hypothetical protein
MAYVPRVVGLWKTLSTPGAGPEAQASGRDARPQY